MFYNCHFYRQRIRHPQSELHDGDHVYIHLKDRSKPDDKDERDWYERAFGKKRNMQQMSLSYAPFFSENAKKNVYDFFVKINYKMYPELADEHDPRQYDQYREYFLLMKGKEEEDDQGRTYYSYTAELELPCGDIKFSYYYKQRNNDHAEKIELPEDYYKVSLLLKI